jgi:hypothetical protein
MNTTKEGTPDNVVVNGNPSLFMFSAKHKRTPYRQVKREKMESAEIIDWIDGKRQYFKLLAEIEEANREREEEREQREREEEEEEMKEEL